MILWSTARIRFYSISLLDFYPIISTTHAHNGLCGTECDNDIHLQNNEIHKVKLITT